MFRIERSSPSYYRVRGSYNGVELCVDTEKGGKQWLRLPLGQGIKAEVVDNGLTLNGETFEFHSKDDAERALQRVMRAGRGGVWRHPVAVVLITVVALLGLLLVIPVDGGAPVSTSISANPLADPSLPLVPIEKPSLR